ncbi:nucleolar protein 8-like [Xenia sp. Carnegie-2017]|uniref:nucleolar protein 8-like n=1 Tax=Xenia sp. Carnegie-2017 TaxID=2897299 RepID=UPI001F03A7CD|nr:nucleolar protein 8-like [Xenia sp. Carnegie-2017]XP_046862312.1 nucleolar protein 8-like [Xenia sp. Carnegie-2017]XP_046862314.1 nucleolar protein 8-like [Xenia sp. Carnegie-2017]
MEISGNDEENNSEENNLEDIFQKEHFEGRSGEKLMAMQQRFGHDVRFKMDERFLDSDDESKSENDIYMGDDIDEELKQEKQLSWKVLHEVLGQTLLTIEDEKDIRNVYRDSIDVHYDPSRKNHSKFEEEVKKKKNRDEATPGTEDVELNKENRVNFSNEGKLPIKSEEKFYAVSDSLKGLLGNNDKDAELFSFFLNRKN